MPNFVSLSLCFYGSSTRVLWISFQGSFFLLIFDIPPTSCITFFDQYVFVFFEQLHCKRDCKRSVDCFHLFDHLLVTSVDQFGVCTEPAFFSVIQSSEIATVSKFICRVLWFITTLIPLTMTNKI